MRRHFCGVFFVALLIGSVGAVPAAAQNGRGVIAGTIKDSAGGVLTGALVELQPGGQRAVSDDQGQFRMPEVTAGQYTLAVTYVGFAGFSSSVTVTAGQTATADAVLKVASESDQMIVTAGRLQGEAEAINITRTADDIVQVLPSKVITSLPNTNVADAVGRLPSVTLERDEGEGKYIQIRGTEPRLSNVTVNDVNIPPPENTVRTIKMDIIPSSLVDRIELSKTLSANQDADAIGGSVNLVTKTPGDLPTITFEGTGGYTPIQEGRWLDSFNGTFGQRFGRDKKLGFLIGGGYDYNWRGIDDVEPSQTVLPLPSGQNIAVTNGEDTREYQYYRQRYGMDVDLDYRLAPGSYAYIRGLYSDFHDFGSTYVYTYNAGNPQSQANGITTFDNTGNMRYREYIRRPDQQVWSFSTGARHDLASTLISYDFAVSRSHQYGGFPTTNFTPPSSSPLSSVAFTEDNTDPLRPRFTAVNPGASIFDPTQYLLSRQELIDSNTADLSLQGSFSVARRYAAGGHLGTFEIGFLGRNQHKFNLSANPYYNAQASFPLSGVLGTFTNPNYYDRSYVLGPLSDYDKIESLLLANPVPNPANPAVFCDATPAPAPGNWCFDEQRTHLQNDSNTYDGNERVIAGYLMNTINFGKNRLQGGVRFEATNESYNANKVNLTNGAWTSTVPVSAGGSYLNVLPSVQWQYMITPNTNIRASYAMGISRPNFADLVPSVQFDPNASPPSVVLGNPGLKATRANDFDLLAEHYFQPLGILQAGFFYKDLSDPIYNTTSKATSGQYNGFQVQQSINGPRAHITGIEASWEQRLSFLPGFLKDFGVDANYSWTTSAVTFPDGFSGGRTDHAALLRQAPNTWNVGATYDKSRLSVRFAVSHNDANIQFYNYVASGNDSDPIVGLKGPSGDIYFYAHTQYDVQGSYRMYKGLHLIVSGLNLTNEVFGFYQGSPTYPIQREFYKPSIIFGFRWTPAGEQ